MTDLTFLEHHEEGYSYWACRNAHGGVHIWVKRTHSELYPEGIYGGVEIHSPKPLYLWDPEPIDKNCWLINCPCYHDGSTLQFDELILPLIRGRDLTTVAPMIRPYLISYHSTNFGDPS